MRKKEYNFQQNVELDAALVFAAMKGGIDGYINACFARRDVFPDTDTAMARSEWLKKQSKAYITLVSERAAELEAGKTKAAA